MINVKGNGGINTETEDLKCNSATLTCGISDTLSFENRETCGWRKFVRMASLTSGTRTSQQMNSGIDGHPPQPHGLRRIHHAAIAVTWHRRLWLPGEILKRADRQMDDTARVSRSAPASQLKITNCGVAIGR